MAFSVINDGLEKFRFENGYEIKITLSLWQNLENISNLSLNYVTVDRVWFVRFGYKTGQFYNGNLPYIGRDNFQAKSALPPLSTHRSGDFFPLRKCPRRWFKVLLIWKGRWSAAWEIQNENEEKKALLEPTPPKTDAALSVCVRKEAR